MSFKSIHIPGLILIEPVVHEDSRGYFFESYNKKLFSENAIENNFVQDNQSLSSYGTVRGLHYQMNPHAQAKLVRVLHGSIIDVAVDIRKGSPTYGHSYTIELSSQNRKQLYIPTGFAHGFSVISETAIVMYKCDTYYNKESEGGIRFDDPTLKIDWQIPESKMIISDKDLRLPFLEACKNNFEF